MMSLWETSLISPTTTKQRKKAVAALVVSDDHTILDLETEMLCIPDLALVAAVVLLYPEPCIYTGIPFYWSTDVTVNKCSRNIAAVKMVRFGNTIGRLRRQNGAHALA
jgi:hypothetical protein